MYSSQRARSVTSLALNFHVLSGLSSRARKRFFCSALDTCRNSFTTLVPLRSRWCSQALRSSWRAAQKSGPRSSPGRACFSSHSGCTCSAMTSSYCERLKIPMRPRSGAFFWMRQRNVWSSSSLEGPLNDTTDTPCGFTPVMTCSIVESLPAASIAWNTTRIEWVSLAHRSSCASLSRLIPRWRTSLAVALSSSFERDSNSPTPSHSGGPSVEAGAGAWGDAQVREDPAPLLRVVRIGGVGRCHGASPWVAGC